MLTFLSTDSFSTLERPVLCVTSSRAARRSLAISVGHFCIFFLICHPQLQVVWELLQSLQIDFGISSVVLELLLLLLVMFASKCSSAWKQCGLREHSSVETHGTHDAAPRCQPVWCHLLQSTCFCSAVLPHPLADLALCLLLLEMHFFYYYYFSQRRKGKHALGWFRRYQCVEKSVRMSKLSSHSSVP